MKKYLTILLLFILLFSATIAKTTSTNTFTINIADIPNNEAQKTTHKDSNHAGTAITLGSIFGGLLLGGAGYYFYKKGIKLTGFCVKSKLEALIPICCNKKIIEKYLKTKNSLLMAILKNEKLDLTCKKKYIFIEDTIIKHNNYNRIYFKMDKDYDYFKIIQYSISYQINNNIPNLDSNIFQDEKELFSNILKSNPSNGILIKEGNYNFYKDNYYFIDTSLINSQNENKYAIVIEFE